MVYIGVVKVLWYVLEVTCLWEEYDGWMAWQYSRVRVGSFFCRERVMMIMAFHFLVFWWRFWIPFLSAV